LPERNDDHDPHQDVAERRRCVGFLEVQLGAVVEDELGKERPKRIVKLRRRTSSTSAFFTRQRREEAMCGNGGFGARETKMAGVGGGGVRSCAKGSGGRRSQGQGAQGRDELTEGLARRCARRGRLGQRGDRVRRGK
jgi:hypothetical protein